MQDGIRHTAPLKGWTHEWVFLPQTHVYKDVDTSLWKPEIYGDCFTFGAPEHFQAPSVDVALKPFLNNTYSFSEPTGTPPITTLSGPCVQATMLNPEAPSAYTYAAGRNSAADDAFRQSRQVYPRPYEVDSATLEFGAGGEQIVVLRLVEKLRRHPNAPAAPTGDVAHFKPTPSSVPCRYESRHSIQFDLVAYPGAYVEVPLEDLA